MCISQKGGGVGGTYREIILHIISYIRITFHSDQESPGWLTTLYYPSMLGG